jgi:hypothetical protein
MNWSVILRNNSNRENWFNYLKTEFILNNIFKSSSYLTGNTLLLATKTSRLMLFKETVVVYCENQTEHTNTL